MRKIIALAIRLRICCFIHKLLYAHPGALLGGFNRQPRVTFVTDETLGRMRWGWREMVCAWTNALMGFFGVRVFCPFTLNVEIRSRKKLVRKIPTESC